MTPLRMSFFNFSLLGDIIHYALGSFILGVVLTILFVVLLFLLIKGFYPRKTFSPLSIIAGAVLCLLLVPQMITLCGAVGLKIKCSDVAEWLDVYVVHSSDYTTPVEITPGDSHVICDRLIDNYPMVASFVGGGEFTGYDTSNICEAISDTLNSFLNQFIWESLGWSFLYLIVAATVVILTMRVENHYGRSARTARPRGDSRHGRVGRQRSTIRHLRHR